MFLVFFLVFFGDTEDGAGVAGVLGLLVSFGLLVSLALL